MQKIRSGPLAALLLGSIFTPALVQAAPASDAAIREAALKDDVAWDITEGLTTEVGPRPAATRGSPSRGGQRTGRGPARPAPSAAAPVDPGRKPRGAGPGGNAAGKGSGGQPDPMKTSVGYIGHDAVARQRKADATRGKGAQPPRGGQGGGKRRGPGR